MTDWLVREGGIVLSWWLMVTLAGVIVMPLCTRLLGALPDKGYTLSRAVGLLLIGFVYWLLASFGFLVNSAGNIILAAALVLVAAVVIYGGKPINWREWWRENVSVVIMGEFIFLALFVGWALVRAHQNGLTGTEKPMELMFISGIMRADTFPPADPWMSGYAISYYYFGYVMSAGLGLLSGISSAVAFNMTGALLFALTGLTTFGVVYNLVRSRALREVPDGDKPRQSYEVALFVGGFGMFFVILMGNFYTPFVEMPYQTGTATSNYLQFWGVDERESSLQDSEMTPGTLDPASWHFWWWFRSARVLNDLDLDGGHIEVIDEFPQFSFLLGDMHPHVLALPFVMLALGMALNLLLTGRDPSPGEVVFYGICIGGLAFLNTWDGPVYAVVLVGVDAVRRLLRNGSGWLSGRDLAQLVWLGARLLILMVLLYLPFWVGFRSQASGILPNFIHPTKTQQFFLMFGAFFFLIPPLLAVETWRKRGTNWLGVLLGLVVGLLLLVMILLLFAALAALSPSIQSAVERFLAPVGGIQGAVPIILERRLEAILTTLLLLAGIILVLNRLFPHLFGMVKSEKVNDGNHAEDSLSYPPETGFVLLLVGAALTLTLLPEFVYLRDNFATRMNTIFKFYYQAWLMFSVAGAYAIYTLLADKRLRLPDVSLQGLFSFGLAVVVVLGSLYPAAGIYSRMFVETGRLNATNTAPLTLDGSAAFLPSSEDYQSILCFNEMVGDRDVVIAEAVGPAYNSGYGRVAALTGLPIILGWENHQAQWRGATYSEVVGSRPGDIRLLYDTPSWEQAQTVINRYGIDYVFYGSSERSSYDEGGLQKFFDFGEVVCERGGSRFFRVTTAQVAVAE